MVVAGATLMRPGDRPVYYQYDFTEQGFVSPGADFAALSFLPGRTGYLYREKDGREWTFDEDGQLQQMQDRNGNLTRYAHGAQGRLVSVTDPVGLVTRLRYRNGYLWQVEDPAGRVSDFERDGHGRLVAVRYPDGSRERYAYDEHHLLVARWDEREQRTGYTYDASGHARQTCSCPTAASGCCRTGVRWACMRRAAARWSRRYAVCARGQRRSARPAQTQGATPEAAQVG